MLVVISVGVCKCVIDLCVVYRLNVVILISVNVICVSVCIVVLMVMVVVVLVICVLCCVRWCIISMGLLICLVGSRLFIDLLI